MLDPVTQGFVYRAKLQSMIADFNELEAACRAEGTPRIQDAIDNAVRWWGAVSPETSPTNPVMDKVKSLLP